MLLMALIVVLVYAQGDGAALSPFHRENLVSLPIY
jgi:hypothetical protein